MNLLLVRHAHATWNGRQWANDSERPLTDLGTKQAEALGQALGRVVGHVDVLMSTPLTRARQTADIIARATGWPSPQVHEPAFSGSDHSGWVKTLLGSFQGLDVPTLAYVGHEPTLSELITLLLGGPTQSLMVEMRPGGAASLSFEGPPIEGEGYLNWLVRPELVMGAH